jgi:hypothetical protein
MSRGPGHVQRASMIALQAEPNRVFTVSRLVTALFASGGELAHFHSVARAMPTLPPNVVMGKRYGKRLGENTVELA